MRAQQTVRSYFSQAFNGNVMAQYGLNALNDAINIIIGGIGK